MMQYRIELLADQRIERGDIAVERAHGTPPGLRRGGSAAAIAEPGGQRLGGRHVPELGGAMRLRGIPMAEKAAGQYRRAQWPRLGNRTGWFRQDNSEVTHRRGRPVLASVGDGRPAAALRLTCRCVKLRGRDTSDIAAPVFRRPRLR